MDESKVILGIHILKKSEDIRENHAWATIEKDGIKNSYSLYPQRMENFYPHITKGRIPDSNVYKNVDLDQQPTTSLYAPLSPTQAAAVEREMHRPQQYDARGNNCCHLAVAAYEVGREEKLHATDPRAPNTAIPDILEKTIRERNLKIDEHIKTAPTAQNNQTDLTQDGPKNETRESQKPKPFDAQSRRERLIQQSKKSREADSRAPNQNDGPKRSR